MSKYVFITGATSGFGEACARKFSSEGYHLIITGRRQERLIQLQQELQKDGNEVFALCFDVRNLKEVEQAIASLPVEVKSNIAILINNAGLAVGREPIDQGNTDDWERMIDTNIKGLLYVSKNVIPFLFYKTFFRKLTVWSWFKTNKNCCHLYPNPIIRIRFIFQKRNNWSKPIYITILN